MLINMFWFSFFSHKYVFLEFGDDCLTVERRIDGVSFRFIADVYFGVYLHAA
jgi:hypothetical protein